MVSNGYDEITQLLQENPLAYKIMATGLAFVIRKYDRPLSRMR